MRSCCSLLITFIGLDVECHRQTVVGRSRGDICARLLAQHVWLFAPLWPSQSHAECETVLHAHRHHVFWLVVVPKTPPHLVLAVLAAVRLLLSVLWQPICSNVGVSPFGAFSLLLSDNGGLCWTPSVCAPHAASLFECVGVTPSFVVCVPDVLAWLVASPAR